MPKKKYVKRPFPRKGVDWSQIKRKKEAERILSLEDIELDKIKNKGTKET